MNTSSLMQPTYQGKHILTWFVIASWFSLVLWNALLGHYHAAQGEAPLALILSIVIPVLAFALLYVTRSRFRDYVQQLDLRLLILLHSWRMLGFGFLIIYAFDHLPLLFALPAGAGDAIAAIGATLIAYRFLHNINGVSRRWIYTWNGFGLLDFFIAVCMGLMTRTGNIGHLTGTVASDAMAQFPLALIPGFIVPFYIITHIIVFLQLQGRYKDMLWIKND